MGVFVGGCTIEAAEAVCGADLPLDVFDGLDSLHSKSLLRQDPGPDGEPRFWMLETIREYAVERLDASPDGTTIRQGHAAYYLDLAEQAEPELRRADQITWLDRLDADHDNLRAVLTGALAAGDAQTALRLAGALMWFWNLRGYWEEGPLWLARVLEHGEEAPAPLRAKALVAAGIFARVREQNDLARERLAEGLALYQGDPYGTALAHLWMGGRIGDETPRAALEQNLADWRALGDPWGTALALQMLSQHLHAEGEHDPARALAEESLRLARTLGDRLSIANALKWLGRIASIAGDYAQARVYMEEGAAFARELNNTFALAVQLSDLGHVALMQGDYAQARRYFEDSLATFQELGLRFGIAVSQTRLGELARAEGDASRAEDLYHQALIIYRDMDHTPAICTTLHNLGYAVKQQGDLARARALFAECLSLACALDDDEEIAYALAGLAGVLEPPELAVRLFGAADAAFEALGIEVEAIDKQAHERSLTALRAHLDEAAFQAAWEAGRALPLAEAAARAAT